MNEILEIVKEITAFNNKRDWSRFHDSKNLALAISLEASELNELFLWKSVEESENVSKERIQEELADVLIYSFVLAAKHRLDIKKIMVEKIRKNELKYPVDKAKGSASKYTDL